MKAVLSATAVFEAMASSSFSAAICRGVARLKSGGEREDRQAGLKILEIG